MVEVGVGVGCLVRWLLHKGVRGVKCEWSCSNSTGYNNCYRLAGRRLLWLWSQCLCIELLLCYSWCWFSYFIPGYLSVFVYGVIVMLWFVLSSG